MQIRIANAAVSWGIRFADNPTNAPWAKVVDEIAAAGYRWIELGPIGYLPQDPAQLADELAKRQLSLIGGCLQEPLHDPAARPRRGAADLPGACAARRQILRHHRPPFGRARRYNRAQRRCAAP